MRAKKMVAAVSTSSSQEEQTKPRSPLLPSEKNNSNNGLSTSQKNHKSKPISSRYMSPSTSSSSNSKRYSSPLLSSSSISQKRSVSADRRRIVKPLTCDLVRNSDVSVATKLLVTSTRSLSVSFQGEAFPLPVSKTKPANVRKLTPERKRNVVTDQTENFKPLDQQRWPGRNRTVKNSLTTSNDFGASERSKMIGSVNELLKKKGNEDLNLIACDSSDKQNVDKEIVVSTKFWQETNSRLRRLQDPSSPLDKLSVPSKSKSFSSDGNVSLLSRRTMGSPSRAGIRQSKVMMTPVASSTSNRGHSPSRIRNAVSTISNKFDERPSVLSYAVDVRRGKVGESRIVDAHLLRLLYNRHLQWRFVNARTELVLMVQKHGAEKNLWNAWITISNLRDTVTKKRHRLQLLRQKLKLASILRGQMISLEEWASLDKDHSMSLLGAIEALKASTLRLPVVGAVNADVHSLKDAIGSAVDVMHAMGSSIRSLLPTVEEVNSLVTELAKSTAKERALLEQCKDFVSLLAAMQVKDSSLRMHILQHNRVPATA